jgi:molybdopterin-guanine dinucleotide biosynthesis protein A
LAELYDAILLTGGSARRLGGIDKPALEIGGIPIVARIAAAVADAAKLIVVGPCPPGVPADVVTREDPPGGGPVAATIAGLSHVDSPKTAVLAGDLPFLTGEVITLLRETADDVALLVDANGRDQLLCAMWRTEALQAATEGLGAGSPMRAVLAAAGTIRRVSADQLYPPPWLDCDTPADLEEIRREHARGLDPGGDHGAGH